MINNTTMRPNVAYSETNTLNYAINQSLLNVNTILPCKILEINNDNTYNIQSIINYVDASGNAVIPAIISSVPATQKRGGNAGIIIQYAVNDIVAVGFCQRDISLIKSNWQTDMPNSLRKFSLADGIILDYLSNDTPVIYISITSTGISIVSNNQPVTVNSGNADITINCKDSIINATDKVIVTANEVDVNSSNINLGGLSGAYILTANTTIVAPSGGGNCVITPGTTSTTTKAV